LVSFSLHPGLQRPHTQSHPPQRSVQHPMQDYGPSTAVRRPRAPSRPGQGSEQHPMHDYGVPTRSHIHLKDQCNTPCRTTASSHAVTVGSRLSATPRAGVQDCGVPTRNHSRLKDQCNTPCRSTASPHAVTAGSRLRATPHAGLWRPHMTHTHGPGQGLKAQTAQCNTAL
jgi:hypothetical protein